MRILQVVHTFPPHSYSGAEKYAQQLSTELARDHEVHVFYPIAGDEPYSLHSSRCDDYYTHELSLNGHKGVNFTNILGAASLAKTIRNARVETIFAEFIRRLRPDVVHFQHLMYLSAELIRIVKQEGIPTVLTLHDYWFLCPTVQMHRHDGSVCLQPEPSVCRKCWSKKRANSIANKLPQLSTRSTIPKDLLRLAFSLVNDVEAFDARNNHLMDMLGIVDLIIAPSHYLRKTFVSFGVPPERILHLHNGYQRQGLSTKTENSTRKKMVFGYVGRIVPIKGVHVLIDAFLNIPTESAELLIYGGYDENSSYIQDLLNRTQNATNIHFMGRTDNISQAYSAIDVLVFPSVWYENCPLVLSERRLTRIPVIASKLGAIPEFVEDGVDGLLFTAGDPTDLFHQMEAFIESPDKVRKFSSNIQANPPTIQEQADKLRTIYEVLVERYER